MKTRITVGHSSPAIIAMLSVSAVVMVPPIIVAIILLEPQMTIVGNNSAAVSAACHSLADLNHFASISQDIESRNEVGEPDAAFPMEPVTLGLLQSDRLGDSSTKVLKKIKWGTIPEAGAHRCIPDGSDENVEVGHLAFSTEDDGVENVVDGSWYPTNISGRHPSFAVLSSSCIAYNSFDEKVGDNTTCLSVEIHNIS